MATLSRKTIALAGSILEGWSRTVIEHFFYEHDVPDDWQFGSSKLAMVMNVLQNYERTGQSGKLLELIQELLKRCGDYSKKSLEAALLRDGFAVSGRTVIDAEPDAAENRVAVLALVEKHENDFEAEILQHHLTECEDLFQQGKWDSSIGHCRNFVEQVLADIAAAIAIARGESPKLSQPRLVRDYLQTAGFLDEAEKKKLVDGVYGYFSEEGSHPGISDHSAARISKNILLSFAFYILEKFDAWRNGVLTLK